MMLEAVKSMTLKPKPFDVAEHLTDAATIADYLAEVAATGDVAAIVHGRAVAARATARLAIRTTVAEAQALKLP